MISFSGRNSTNFGNIKINFITKLTLLWSTGVRFDLHYSQQGCLLFMFDPERHFFLSLFLYLHFVRFCKLQNLLNPEIPILGQLLDLISPAKISISEPRLESYDPWDMAN